ncbi:DUF4134 domain-containing protein [Mucilaginibacter aquariorum]|uniref:DUF4134 domain-containing protein n=1 Tax=Mucilaginibacter aquariorum TaxID=2967225 RepID=A0ABT1SYI8_9SPHI|nr:DUF4134 domain-containing protein [Mucilaginibacter aquariorum]
MAIVLLLISASAFSQDGNAGINKATNQVKSYFATVTNSMYAIGAIVGLVGAIKVYKKWNDGEHDTGKVASGWFWYHRHIFKFNFHINGTIAIKFGTIKKY